MPQIFGDLKNCFAEVANAQPGGRALRSQGAAGEPVGGAQRWAGWAALDTDQRPMEDLLSVVASRWSSRSGNRRLPLKTMKKEPQIPLGPAANTPGEILQEEFLTPLGISLRELARRAGCGPTRLSEIVHGKRAVTAETSILLGSALGVSPGFFLGLQTDYDLAAAFIKMRRAPQANRRLVEA